MADMLGNMGKAAELRGGKRPNRSALRDALLVAGGTAAGAGLGYGTAALLKKRYGDVAKGIPPDQRLKYLVPAASAIGGLSALTHVLRQRAELRAERAESQKHAAFYMRGGE